MEKLRAILRRRAVDRGQIAHLPAGERVARLRLIAEAEPAQMREIVVRHNQPRMQPDFDARIRAELLVRGKIESRLAELLLALEEMEELLLRRRLAVEQGGV